MSLVGYFIIGNLAGRRGKDLDDYRTSGCLLGTLGLGRPSTSTTIYPLSARRWFGGESP